MSEVSPTTYRVRGLSGVARLGHIVELRGRAGAKRGEIVQIGPKDVLVAPFDQTPEAGIGDPVFDLGPFTVTPHRVLARARHRFARARAIDGGPGMVDGDPRHASSSTPPSAMTRQRVDTAFLTGVRVIDIFTPICFGQRLGIFAGSGVGKSTLLAMLAGADAFDTVVVALVGERGREVREFLEDTIGKKGLAKTVAVVATSDESAMMRKRAPDTAMRVAEHFRDQGHRVLLVLDSVTRFAHALREVAIGAGEPPIARGYPPSVFTELPKLLERAGPGMEGSGSITAIISVLVDGDDHNDPIADSVRGILDGHVVLDRVIAEQGRYPAGQSAVVDLAPGRQGLERRPARARASAAPDDLALRGHARHPPARRLPDGRRRRTRHGRAPGPADLRGAQPVAARPAIARSVRRPCPAPEAQGQAQCNPAKLSGHCAACWTPRRRRALEEDERRAGKGGLARLFSRKTPAAKP